MDMKQKTTLKDHYKGFKEVYSATGEFNPSLFEGDLYFFLKQVKHNILSDKQIKEEARYYLQFEGMEKYLSAPFRRIPWGLLHDLAHPEVASSKITVEGAILALDVASEEHARGDMEGYNRAINGVIRAIEKKHE